MESAFDSLRIAWLIYCCTHPENASPMEETGNLEEEGEGEGDEIAANFRRGSGR